MKIKIKIPIIIFSIVLIIGLVTTIVSQTILRNIVQQQVFRHLETTAQSRVAHIETFIELKRKTVNQLSQSIVIQELLLADKNDEDYAEKINTATKRLKTRVETGEYTYGVFVIDKEGIIVASSEEVDIGKDKSGDPYFLGGKQGTFIKDAYVAQDRRICSFAFSAPVLDDNNKFLGVVVMRFSIEGLNKITTDRTGLGETGEIYLVNKDSYMITPSRFIDDTFLKQKVDTENARENGHEAVLCKNYLGKSVLGIHAHIPETGWCLLAEMSEREAFASIIKLTHIRILILTVFLVGGIILSIILSRTIIKPIVELHRGTEEITRGNLDYKVGKKSRDEIGQLSRAFDEMTANLKKSRDKLEEYSKGLEKKVEERITDLTKINEQLKREITERKKTEEKLRLFSQAVNSSIDGVATGNLEGRITYVNEAFVRMFGYSREELIGQEIVFIYAEDQIPKLEEALKATMEGGWTGELVGKRKDGKLFPMAISSSLIKDDKGKVIAQMAVHRDITETKKAEDALRQYTVELEERNQELDAFAHTVAHDLKNPLNNIFSFAQVLEKAHTTMTNEKLRHYLHTITQNGIRMRNIIDELLLLSKVRKLEMDLVPLNMANIVSSAQQRLVYMIEQYKAEVILTDTWPKSLGYGPWVEEVWVNYISNAIKYGGRPPRVELGATVQSDGNVRFWVRDNGSGISPEEQKRLFTPYTRISQIRVEGYGLGLSIVRRIMEKICGKVGMESKIGTGSTFWFTLSRV
ncbi:PAS domain S-box protein [candidate division WOR-3 bacterium]|nr:PAS domain S-box protein [candidate division WOR-3 bacterium]